MPKSVSKELATLMRPLGPQVVTEYRIFGTYAEIRNHDIDPARPRVSRKWRSKARGKSAVQRLDDLWSSLR